MTLSSLLVLFILPAASFVKHSLDNGISLRVLLIPFPPSFLLLFENVVDVLYSN